MAYAGYQIEIDCAKGGFCGSNNVDTMPTEMMVWPSSNINIQKGVRQPRGGTQLYYSTAFSGAPEIRGLYQFRLTSGTEFIMVATEGGKLYKNSTTTIKTGMSTANFFSFENMENTLYVADGDTQIQTWDGAAAATSDLATPHADWGGATYDFPFQIVRHKNVNSTRMFALNKDALYWSIAGDGTNFTGVGSGVIYLDTGDGFGFVGMIEFGDRLFVFGKKKCYILDDSSTTITDWALYPASWEGGTMNWRTLVKTLNNLFSLTEEGDIYSVITTEAYGDYVQASIAAPAGVDDWIQEHCNMAYIHLSHGVWDTQNRQIKWFLPKEGSTTINMCLPFCYYREPYEAWCPPYFNDSYDNGYKASVAVNTRESSGVYRILTGDYEGLIWKTETTTLTDNGFGYLKAFKTPEIGASGDSYAGNSPARQTKHWNYAWVVMYPKGEYYLYATSSIDGMGLNDNDIISLAGIGDVLDSFVLDTDTLGEAWLKNARFDIKRVGQRVNTYFYNSAVNADFSIARIIYDYKPMGAKQ